ncbi:MAG TPA: phosphatidylglycerophosphatase A [Candidatus Aquilonibacter sp.]|nr:phosphatidylglycerophosphatase A [Candidatus Aquilonibacter sp.]
MKAEHDNSQSAAEPNPGTGPDRSSGVSPAFAGASRPRGPLWAYLIATFFGIGRIRPGPGTWASAATVLLWAAVAYGSAPALHTPLALVLAVAVTLIGIPAATTVARATSIKDPQFVVIDEVAGQLIALIAVPLAWKSFVSGFILFRGFDILKPWPVRHLEALPEGTGIVLDDVAAGLYALACMHLLLHLGLLK